MRSARRLGPLAAALLLLASACSRDTGSEKRIFWKISSDKGEVYLAGSVHFGNESMKPPQEIEDAFTKSAALAVEADPANMEKPDVVAHIREKGVYGEGDSLEKHVSKETWKALGEYAEKHKIPVDSLKPLRPWFAALNLEAASYKRAGLEAENGIDDHFLKKARDKKKIIELESIEFQIDLFAGMDDRLQEKDLAESLEDDDKFKSKLNGMLDAWKKGDGKALDQIVREESKDDDSKKFLEKIVDERNVKMAEAIEGFLKEKGPTFVCVGAMHCVGEKGIVSILEKTGKYKVEQPKVTPTATKETEPAGSGAK